MISKLLFYGFLGEFRASIQRNSLSNHQGCAVEKAYIVWRAIGSKTRRIRSPIYVFSHVLTTGYVVVVLGLILPGAFIVLITRIHSELL
jgi:hypothetical protein